MFDPSSKQVEVGVVLQGGGALGAYECGALDALLELIGQFEGQGCPIVLKTVSGVSIGAINGACVVGAADHADARRRLAALWDDLALQSPSFWPWQARRDLSLFGLPGFYQPRIDLWAYPTWTNYYDNSPLLATLARHIDFVALNRSKTTFVVTAVDVESGELKRFSNHALNGDPAVEIAAEHIRASGSLPPQFPWTKIDRHIYWDGALIDNAPLGDAIDAFSHGGNIIRVLVVMDLYPLRAPRPRNLAEVEDRVHELTYGNHVRQDRVSAGRINDLVATIEALAELVPADALDGRLKDCVDRAREFKVIKFVDLDMQDRGAKSGPQTRSDDQYGLRDFSPTTVHERREAGRRIARARLRSVFESCGLLPANDIRPAAVLTRS